MSNFFPNLEQRRPLDWPAFTRRLGDGALAGFVTNLPEGIDAFIENPESSENPLLRPHALDELAPGEYTVLAKHRGVPSIYRTIKIFERDGVKKMSADSFAAEYRPTHYPGTESFLETFGNEFSEDGQLIAVPTPKSFETVVNGSGLLEVKLISDEEILPGEPYLRLKANEISPISAHNERIYSHDIQGRGHFLADAAGGRLAQALFAVSAADMLELSPDNYDRAATQMDGVEEDIHPVLVIDKRHPYFTDRMTQLLRGADLLSMRRATVISMVETARRAIERAAAG